MREIRRDPAYVDDPEIRDYVQSIGYRLVAASGETRQEFEFFVVRDRTVNAFAMPGGFIGVHTGLLLAAQTESEFASVMGHEIAHVLQRHMARQYDAQSKISKMSLLAMALALLAARSNPQVAQAAIVAGQAAPAAVYLNHSREFEREADRLGYQLLDGAGFDTAGMPGFFERLQKATRLYENNAPTYLRTHPLTSERIADMQNRQAGAPYRQRPDSIEFQLVRAKVRATDGTPDEAVTFFRARSPRNGSRTKPRSTTATPPPRRGRRTGRPPRRRSPRRASSRRRSRCSTPSPRGSSSTRATSRAPRRSSPRRAPPSPIRWRSGSSTRRRSSGSGGTRRRSRCSTNWRRAACASRGSTR